MYTGSFLLLMVYPAFAYEYVDDFEDEQCSTKPSHWLVGPSIQSDAWKVGCETGNQFYRQDNIVGIHYTYLHVFERNPEFSGRFRVTETDSGYVAFLIRYNAEGSYAKAGYNWATQNYELWEQEEKNLPAQLVHSSPATLPEGWNTFKVSMEGSKITLWINDTLRIQSNALSHTTYGRLGFETYQTTADFDDITYRGVEGRVNEGVLEYPLKIYDANGQNMAQHLTIETLNDGSLLGLVGRADDYVISSGRMQPLLLVRSTQQGRVWENTDFADLEYLVAEGDTVRHCCPQLLKLQSGALLSFGLTKHGNGQFVKSSDGGQSWKKAGTIAPLNRHAIMPDKLIQASEGTIYGSLQRVLYHSQDEAESWLPIDTFPLYDAPTRYVSVQEMQLVELPDRSFKIYARDGRDGSHTLAMGRAKEGAWNDLKGQMNNTPFVSPKNAFNIQQDPHEPGHYYAFWTYNDRNDEPSVNNLPRTRLALSVSYDGAQSWQYVMDVEEWGYPTAGPQYKDNRYANLAMHVDEKYIYLTAKQRDPIGEKKHADTNVWFTRVEKSKIQPYPQFPGTHY